jgi:regulator of sigma E protease
MSLVNIIIPFIILISVVVFVHEYGHYYYAKKYGVKVTDFSIGFGKEFFGWTFKLSTITK